MHLRCCGLVTAAVHYCNSHEVKLLLIYSLASLSSLTGMLWGSQTPNVVPIACGGDAESVSSSVGYFQSPKESAAMTAFQVPIFSLVCSSAWCLHITVSVAGTARGCRSEALGWDQHDPIAWRPRSAPSLPGRRQHGKGSSQEDLGLLLEVMEAEMPLALGEAAPQTRWGCTILHQLRI